MEEPTIRLNPLSLADLRRKYAAPSRSLVVPPHNFGWLSFLLTSLLSLFVLYVCLRSILIRCLQQRRCCPPQVEAQ